MKKRIITACIGIPFLIFCLVVRGWFAEIVIAALTLIGLYECNRALGAANHVVFPWGGYIGAVLSLPLSWLLGIRNPILLVSASIVITITGCIFSSKPSFVDAAASLHPICTCLLPFLMMGMLLNSTYGRVPGIALVTMSFAIAYCGDAAAYFGGRAFGRRKLCPELSPNKTVEGAIFYFIGSTVGALIVRFVFVYCFKQAMPGIPAAIVLGILGGFAGQIGDLSASLLKRYSGIKDYGNILPGHGGVMDRFDSVLFTIIVLYCYTLLLK